jgi:hypothetical protein
LQELLPQDHNTNCDKGNHTSCTRTSSTATDTDTIDILNILSTIDECQTSMEVAIGILNDLLAYEKIESGIFQVNPVPVLADDFFKETVGEFYLQVTNATITYEKHVYYL